MVDVVVVDVVVVDVVVVDVVVVDFVVMSCRRGWHYGSSRWGWCHASRIGDNVGIQSYRSNSG